MIVVLLIKKTTALFLIMCMGMLLVKKRNTSNAGDSRVISAISIHLILPLCNIKCISGGVFTGSKGRALLSLVAAVIIKCGADCACNNIFRNTAAGCGRTGFCHIFKCREPCDSHRIRDSWSGMGYLFQRFLAVQMFLIWSHGKMVLCGRKTGLEKKVFANINMLAIALGILSPDFRAAFSGAGKGMPLTLWGNGWSALPCW